MSDHTERAMFAALHRRYNNAQYIKRGNGIRWVCAEHVCNDSGFWAARSWRDLGFTHVRVLSRAVGAGLLITV